MKKTFTLLLIAGFVCLLTSCEKQEEMTVTPIFKEKISGYAQKGPFISGTSITIAELNNRMGQTGKMFDTQITNNEGCFELNNVELSSPYVELKATGFYFNEVSGKTSNAQITLNAIADLQDAATLNVNILSHLEKPRITYLMSLGNDFASAKTQAQKEVLPFSASLKKFRKRKRWTLPKQETAMPYFWLYRSWHKDLERKRNFRNCWQTFAPTFAKTENWTIQHSVLNC